ncbi:hypothetical protein [Rhodoferax bucti]|uniref:hypothetical protein n=1 Tax=Rhodoferax bucti TaxID=2576305 RepID=UPI001108B462|nr:hypothetical protein [Rhodoferax bucti]
MKNPNELKARFPYMFDEANLGISIARGWFPMFAKLCEDIDELLGSDKKNFRWIQAKEKFGVARWHYRIDGLSPSIKVRLVDHSSVVTVLRDSSEEKPAAKVQELVAELIASAENKTHTTCIVCGDAGHPDSHTGYVLVLCAQHAHQRKNEGNQSMRALWFNDDEDSL